MGSELFIFASDFHLGRHYPFLIVKSGLSKRTLDLFVPLEELLVYAEGKANDYDSIHVFFLGDFYDKVNPNPNVRVRACELLKAFPANAHFYVLGGNHDVSRDIRNRACSIDELALLGNVAVFKEVCSVIVGGVGFVVVPFVRPSYLAESLPDADGTSVLASASAELHRRIDAEVAKVKNCATKIAIVHHYVQGMKYNDQSVGTVSNEFTIPQEYFAGVDNVIAGHVHLPQDFANVQVVGSPERVTFAERDEQKRFLVFDGNAFKSVPFRKNRKMVQIEINYSGGTSAELQEEVRQKVAAAGIKRAIVRLQVSCKLVERQFVVNSVGQELFAGAFYVYPISFKDRYGDFVEDEEIQRLSLSYRKNFLDYMDALFIEEKFPGFKVALRERGIGIIDKIVTEGGSK